MLQNPVKAFIYKRKSTSVLVVLLGVVCQILTITIPVSIGKYYQLAFNFNARRMRFLNFIPDVWWNTIPKFLIVFLLLIVIRFILFFSYQYILQKEAEIFIKQIKDKLFSYQMYVDNQIYKEKGTGKYLLRYSGDINSLKRLYLKGGISIWVDGFVIVLALTWLAYLSKLGALIVLLGAVFGYVFVHFCNKKIEFFSIEKRNRTSGQLSFVSRTLQAFLSVILFEKQEVKIKKYKKKSEKIKQAGIQLNAWQVVNKGFISFLQYAILTLVLWVFYKTSTPETLSGANLISFILLYVTILPIIRRFFALETVYKMGNISVEKLQHIFTLKTENLQKGKTINSTKISVDFKNVILENTTESINFLIKEGDVLTVQLPKKNTPLMLIEAIMKLNKNYNGTILVNNEDIKAVSRTSVRNTIAIASPNIPLLGRTVYEAVTVFRAKRIENNTRVLVKKIQKKFKDNALALKDRIGENGSNISALQYEVLCLIRGINNDKKIILIDEFKLIKDDIIKEVLKSTGKTAVFLKNNV